MPLEQFLARIKNEAESRQDVAEYPQAGPKLEFSAGRKPVGCLATADGGRLERPPSVSRHAFGGAGLGDVAEAIIASDHKIRTDERRQHGRMRIVSGHLDVRLEANGGGSPSDG